MILILFIIINLIIPKTTYAVYEEYFFYKNCQNKEALTLNQQISQEFSIDKDFGAIEVYFEREGIGDGKLEFRLEKKNGNMVYNNIYPLEKVINGYFFPFGFETQQLKQPESFVFYIKLIENPNNAKIYVCKDNKNNLSYKISGERSVLKSIIFWSLYNIRQDPYFFAFYFLLLLGVIFIWKRI
ncbi:MAG: hypothetical protein KatS3mg090_0480 [Patescibacteria group bacterium]|nr:MAG: hypothetical protein KatS3mg090_0480 [Patescibacteria group bacterium]